MAASRNSFGGGARWLRSIERDWETEGGLWSIRVPRQFVRWFYRARRGQRRRHCASDGRDVSAAMSSFWARIHSNRLATDADGLWLDSRTVSGIWLDPYRQGDMELCVLVAFMRRRRGWRRCLHLSGSCLVPNRYPGWVIPGLRSGFW
jgi:hypothetical protein